MMETNATVSTRNVTNSQDREDAGKMEHLEIYLILCSVTTVINLCTTIWIIASMVVYGKTDKLLLKNQSAKRLYLFCFATITLTIPRLLLHLVLLYEARAPGSTGHCELIMDLSHAFNGVVIYMTYIFLWMRQRAIYPHPALKKDRRKCINALSWATFALLTVAFVPIICGYTVPNDYSSTATGCNLTPGDKNDTSNIQQVWGEFRGIVTAGCMILIQGALIFLFLYLLIQNRCRRGKTGGSSSSARDQVMAAIRRSAVSASVASATDVSVAIVVCIFSKLGYPLAITDTVIVLDPLINSICILTTFSRWKNILTVLCCRHEYHESDTSPTTKAVGIKQKH